MKYVTAQLNRNKPKSQDFRVFGIQTEATGLCTTIQAQLRSKNSEALVLETASAEETKGGYRDNSILLIFT